MSIGTRIKTLRREKNISLRNFASSVGISVAYLTKIEKEESSPTIDVAERIAEVFGMPLHELTLTETTVESVAPPRPESLEGFIKEYAGKFPELKEPDWQLALSNVRLRGKYPKSPDDWLPVFASMRRALESED